MKIHRHYCILLEDLGRHKKGQVFKLAISPWLVTTMGGVCLDTGQYAIFELECKNSFKIIDETNKLYKLVM